jgi:hypothetical protein
MGHPRLKNRDESWVRKGVEWLRSRSTVGSQHHKTPPPRHGSSVWRRTAESGGSGTWVEESHVIIVGTVPYNVLAEASRPSGGEGGAPIAARWRGRPMVTSGMIPRRKVKETPANLS